jgi:hypothetical protein
MTLRSYLASMIMGTVLAWTGVVMILTMTDPTDARAVVLGIFYTALFLALTGTLSLAGFGMRIWLLKQHYFVSRQVLVSFRQAMLLALLAVTALILQSKSILSWWNALLILGAVTLLESFFITAKVK